MNCWARANGRNIVSQQLRLQVAKKNDLFQTLRNNMQQGVQTDAKAWHPIMLGVVGQQCSVRLRVA